METLFLLFPIYFELFFQASFSLTSPRLGAFSPYFHNTPAWVYCRANHREIQLFISFSTLHSVDS